VEVSGANQANVFETPSGGYVIPVTSRTRHLADKAREPVTLTLRVPDARRLMNAQVRTLGSPPAPALMRRKGGVVEIAFDGHGAASVVIIGARKGGGQRTKGM
jgi:hypothetical protein